ncbi:DoxX family protein [Blastococcus sp. VKM Ac-2987]|uniref:DoxX family protein n=1 Tax=Blastococcus sp. VKM Ac-2987 TaxID=3004141 RepID=UPI0022AB5C85|nr:DoxX family protein [Blastococcus sp. VKM Ac-2987]MCZ2858445.1 DoxX family protein [Blastococcus sp. VKM Ac-2987]
MLVRRIARPLLAAPFVYGGVSTLRKPQDRVPGARPVVEKIADTADKQLPVQLPRDVEQWVKVDAAIKVAAGSLFALNRFPRLTALVLSASIVPTTLAGHRFWEHDDPTEQFGQISNFLKNTGLLGGLLLAAVDTEGKPSVGYRTRRAASRAANATEKNFAQAQKRAAKAQRRTERRLKKKSR